VEEASDWLRGRTISDVGVGWRHLPWDTQDDSRPSTSDDAGLWLGLWYQLGPGVCRSEGHAVRGRTSLEDDPIAVVGELAGYAYLVWLVTATDLAMCLGRLVYCSVGATR
jgi:hypothetical protein